MKKQSSRRAKRRAYDVALDEAMNQKTVGDEFLKLKEVWETKANIAHQYQVAVEDILDNPGLTPPHEMAGMREHQNITESAA